MQILSPTPEPLGRGFTAISTVAARVDHVRLAGLSDTTETQGVLPLYRGGTGSGLSPAVGAVLSHRRNLK